MLKFKKNKYFLRNFLVDEYITFGEIVSIQKDGNILFKTNEGEVYIIDKSEINSEIAEMSFKEGVIYLRKNYKGIFKIKAKQFKQRLIYFEKVSGFIKNNIAKFKSKIKKFSFKKKDNTKSSNIDLDAHINRCSTESTTTTTNTRHTHFDSTTDITTTNTNYIITRT